MKHWKLPSLWSYCRYYGCSSDAFRAPGFCVEGVNQVWGFEKTQWYGVPVDEATPCGLKNHACIFRGVEDFGTALRLMGSCDWGFVLRPLLQPQPYDCVCLTFHLAYTDSCNPYNL